ncbi:protein of unknown function [Ruminococcaceae bacterium BL-6]|nr:protein of unknown function [Ruminococcaceae bacterium BL-6]
MKPWLLLSRNGFYFVPFRDACFPNVGAKSFKELAQREWCETSSGSADCFFAFLFWF